MIDHNALTYLPEAKNLGSIHKAHATDGCTFFSIPGKLLHQLYTTKPPNYLSHDMVYCPDAECFFVELHLLAPTGRIVTVTAQGLHLTGEQYCPELGTGANTLYTKW